MSEETENGSKATGGGTFRAAIKPATLAASAASAMSTRSISNRGSSRLPPIANEKAPATGAEEQITKQSASTAAGGGTVGGEVAPVVEPEQTSAPAPMMAPASPNYKVLRQIASINSKLQNFKTDSDISKLTELISAIALEFTKTMDLRSDLQKLRTHYNFTPKQMEQLIDASYLKSEPYTKFRKEMIEKNKE